MGNRAKQELTGHDHSIKTRLAKAKAQAKQPAVAEGKKYKTHIKGKGDMIRSIRTAY